jgi:hypothetical protein
MVRLSPKSNPAINCGLIALTKLKAYLLMMLLTHFNGFKLRFVEIYFTALNRTVLTTHLDVGEKEKDFICRHFHKQSVLDNEAAAKIAAPHQHKRTSPVD